MKERTTISTEITGQLNNWYVSMRNQDIEQAQQLRQIIDNELDTIQHDPTLTVYYSLLDFRQKVLERNFTDAYTDLNRIEKHRDDMDNLLLYYYFFFKGMYAYSKKRYDEAINNYQLAEKMLEYIHDPIERAEFNYKVGQTYFYLDYLNLAITHIQKALDIFKSQKHFPKRCTDCKVLLGSIYKDLKKYDFAMFYYEEGLNESKNLNDSSLHKIIHINLGELYAIQGSSETALDYFKKGLKFKEIHNLDIITLYFLTKECFKADKNIEAEHWLQKGLDLAATAKNEVFKQRFIMLDSLYKNEEKVFEAFSTGIELFREEGLWDRVEEDAHILADYLYNQEYYKEASEYLKLVTEAKERISLKGRLLN